MPTDEDIAALPHYQRDQLILIKFLGSGAFGEVFEGIANNILSTESGNTKVAVKVNYCVIVGWPGTQFGDSNTMSNITDFQCRI